MNTSEIIRSIRENAVFGDVVAGIGEQASLHLQGLVAPARSAFVEALRQETGRQIVVICGGEDDVDHCAARLSLFAGGPIWQRVAHSANLVGDPGQIDDTVAAHRLETLNDLAGGRPISIVTTIGALLQPTPAPDAFRAACLAVRTGEVLDLEEMAGKLAGLGYRGVLRVTEVGEFSKRGGILDIYPPGAERPYRIEFFGDEVESIRTFDPESQRSVDTLREAYSVPSHEMIIDRKRAERAAIDMLEALEREAREGEAPAEPRLADRIAAAYPREQIEEEIEKLDQGAYFDGVEKYRELLGFTGHNLLSYLPPDAIIVIDEPSRVASRWDELQAELALRPAAYVPAWRLHSFQDVVASLADRRRVLMSRVAVPTKSMGPLKHLEIDSASLEFFSQNLEGLAAEARNWLSDGTRVFLITDKPQRMTDLLGEANLLASASATLDQPVVHVVEGALDSGFKIDGMGIAVLSEADIFGTRAVTERMLSRARRGKRDSVPITSYMDISPGDYLVHIHHGIGLYRGMQTLVTDGASSEYLYLDYANGGKLFVPVDQVDRVQRYIGSDDSPPKMNSLGSSEWQRTKRHVQKRVQEMAAELVQIHAARQAQEGVAFSPDTPWQQEMESSFVYDETPGQMEAIIDVKKDLETPKPMDRLICGDVGYGKTEVAVRAAFKVVLDGKQVAVLVPTTVLAEQHLTTFRERLAAYPVRVEVLSRFRSKKEQEKIVADIIAGAVDVVVGTHRLLSKDVVFKDLGLVIVDEEQRFGVAHKEKLKQLRKTVDVLTLTATPIPRTLHMSLSGIRDMSVINDPPEGRIPIKTMCDEYSDDLVRSAIRRELDRDGQIYYVHNRVSEIAHVADHVKRLVPQARVVVGHGQMPESGLEKVMLAFYHHEFDVLVCTTIIESGLDIPNVNTIIIDDAERYGLATLYQLRGRVGRSDRQAHSYFLHRQGLMLKDQAWKRIEAIREFSDLGSGFRIALRDLEIRGAGNLLGAEQHGFMVSVGFDLYCQMLAEAVRELKGEEPIRAELPEINLPVNAYLPSDYVGEEADRIRLYKKIASSRSYDTLAAIAEELKDRFGRMPKETQDLLEVAALRIRAGDAKVKKVTAERDFIAVELDRNAWLLDAEAAVMSRTITGATVSPGLVKLPRDHRDPVKKLDKLIEMFLLKRRTLTT